jgi:hypothetical protein
MKKKSGEEETGIEQETNQEAAMAMTASDFKKMYKRTRATDQFK